MRGRALQRCLGGECSSKMNRSTKAPGGKQEGAGQGGSAERGGKGRRDGSACTLGATLYVLLVPLG